MNSKALHAVIATFSAIALLGAGTWVFGPGVATAGSERPTGERANGAELEQRISRLEDEIRALRNAPPRNVQGTRSGSGVQDARAESGDDVERQEKFKSTLSSGFAAQPVDSAWALKTRIELEEQLVNTAVEQPDFPAPETTRMQCRSTTCRIEARYEDEDSALYGVQLLQSAFSSKLPSAHQYSVNNPDGSVTIVMYASKGST